MKVRLVAYWLVGRGDRVGEVYGYLLQVLLLVFCVSLILGLCSSLCFLNKGNSCFYTLFCLKEDR